MGLLCHILVLYDLFHEYVKKDRHDAVFRFGENKKEIFDKISFKNDPYGIRTRVTAVKGRCLNRLTNGPDQWRRRRDLNPRAAYATYTLSRGASSAT